MFFQAGGMRVALNPRVSLCKGRKRFSSWTGLGGITLAYNACAREEVDSVLAEAETAGAKLLKPIQEDAQRRLRRTFYVKRRNTTSRRKES